MNDNSYSVREAADAAVERLVASGAGKPGTYVEGIAEDAPAGDALRKMYTVRNAIRAAGQQGSMAARWVPLTVGGELQYWIAILWKDNWATRLQAFMASEEQERWFTLPQGDSKEHLNRAVKAIRVLIYRHGLTGAVSANIDDGYVHVIKSRPL